MLLLLLLSCQPTSDLILSDDLDGVHWEGEFSWSSAPEEAAGVVEFDLNEEDDGTFLGEFVYTSAALELVYEVTGRIDDGVLTLTQTAVLHTEDLGTHTACEGDYVLTLAEDGESLSGEYFPRTPACIHDTGVANFTQLHVAETP
jgi:hypothetical protein